MQPDDRGKRACTLGLGQIPLYVVAQNEPARNVPLRDVAAIMIGIFSWRHFIDRYGPPRS
jgi:hypothetical protein